MVGWSVLGRITAATTWTAKSLGIRGGENGRASREDGGGTVVF